MTASLTTTTVCGQPGNAGTINVDRGDYVYHLKRSDSLQGYKQLVREKQRDIDTLQARIVLLQSIISNLNEKDSATVRLYQEQLAVMKDQKTLYQDQLNGYEKLLRKERRAKKFFKGAAGVGVIGIAVLLLSK